MPATTIGSLAGSVSFGLNTTSEGGIAAIITSFSETRNIEQTEIRNNQGDVAGLILFNQTDDISISGYVSGTVSTTAGGIISSLTNSVVTAGTGKIVVKSVSVKKEPGGLSTLDVSMTRYPNIS